MMKHIFAASTIAASIVYAGTSQASIFINFDAVTSYANVDNFYDGGTDSAGASGPNLGVDFVGWTTASGFGATSQPNLAYNSADPATIDVAAGFSAGLAFTQGLYVPGHVGVYAGLDGTGSLLGSLDLPASDPNAFAPVSLRFSGVAESVVFTGPVGNLGIDDLALGAPEPSTWAMMALGFAGLGFAGARARRSAVAAL
ncbi:putative secreted protein with PEP-CTERM sorting signal [Roseiarcus fermentans]|uniref:Putative secreted protein with PEP-CTERM sorting signal n=1 Tax=Roseiarcus fermentans TaxID=1473586 RepID=A0A366FIE3_9HYPH|nr:PEP-CTERM sorting domain-containing protein [Roseiarcus fermentans]RBP13886.1 putative secreted protein with PEP-CTERM sorting signal [Roseiarcus fermentans]